MDFSSYDQTTSTDYRQQSSAQLSYPHADWSERQDQGDERVTSTTFNPTFQSSTQYLSQPNTYRNSPGDLVSVQHQPLNTPFSNHNPPAANTTDLSLGLSVDSFLQPSEEYRRRGDNFSPQHTTFSNPALAQLPPPPALYHPGGQPYRHQGLPFSDVKLETNGLELFGGGPIHSRVSSQDGSFPSLDSPSTQQSLPLHASPAPPRNGKTRDKNGYGQSPPTANSLKRVRSQEDPFAYDPAPSGDDFDQPKEDINRAKSGACARCKNLKVKCEFREDSDTCRRCSNGGHECVIPGRKKRRIPPKREHLLNEIRAQAAEIQRLMTQLQLANQQAVATTQRDTSPTRNSRGSGGTTRSPSKVGIAYLPPDKLAAAEQDGGPKPEVLDWVAKAKESIEAFGGYIGIGTASVSKNLIEDSGDSGSDDDERFLSAHGSEDEGEGVSVVSGDRELASRHVSPEERGRKRDPNFSFEKQAAVPSHVAPFGLMADLLRKTRLDDDQDGGDAGNPNAIGIARRDYFRAATPDPTARIEDVDQDVYPDILTGNIVTPGEVEKLFKIYFDYMNPSLSIVDPMLYTAGTTYHRSPLLFTVICAIASRHFPENPKLYRAAMCCARRIAASSFIIGQKSVEMVIAYILLALYPIPVKRYEDDRSWVFLGMAIRMALDLNLNVRSTVKPKDCIHARELLNRTRVWLNCYNVDRSMGTQHGRAPTIPDDDWIASHSEDWWKSSDLNIKGFDIHTAAYTSELRVVSQFRAKIYSDPESPTGLNKNVDFVALACETDDDLVKLREHWQPIFAANNDPADLRAKFRTSLINLVISYARLVALSMGLKRHSGGTDDPFITRCWHAARDVCFVVVDELNSPEMRILMRHGPDGLSVFATFASAFLVKLLHPKYIPVFTQEQRQESYNLIQRVIDALGSPEIAVDDRHGPKLYSKLLTGLLATVKLDAPYPGRRGLSHARKLSSRNSPSLASSSPSRSSASPLMPSTAQLSNSQIKQIQADDGQNSPGDGSFGDSPSSMKGLNVQEFFAPPLPFDGELLHSVQNLTNSTEWEGAALPGWNWMGGLQPPEEAPRAPFPASDGFTTGDFSVSGFRGY